MSYHYTESARTADKWALPDCEVFETQMGSCVRCAAHSPLFNGDERCEECASPARPKKARLRPLKQWKWFYAFGLPGCLYDSDPCGPYDTEAEALAAAREAAGVCPHGVADDDECGECDR